MRIDLEKMILDPRPSFEAVWLHQKYWCLKNAQKDVECRRSDKGWLTAKLGHTVIAGHQSAPGGLEWLPLSSKNINFGSHWPGEDDFRPASFFPKRLG